MESIQEVVEEKIEAVLESKKEEVQAKVEEVVQKVDEVADKVCEKVEESTQKVIDKLEDVVPGASKLVDIVDEALVGQAISCGCLGWTFSAVKSQKMKASQK